MERFIALLEKRLAELQASLWGKPEFDLVKYARRIGAIEELGRIIDEARLQGRSRDEQD